MEGSSALHSGQTDGAPATRLRSAMISTCCFSANARSSVYAECSRSSSAFARLSSPETMRTAFWLSFGTCSVCTAGSFGILLRPRAGGRGPTGEPVSAICC